MTLRYGLVESRGCSGVALRRDERNRALKGRGYDTDAALRLGTRDEGLTVDEVPRDAENRPQDVDDPGHYEQKTPARHVANRGLLKDSI